MINNCNYQTRHEENNLLHFIYVIIYLFYFLQGSLETLKDEENLPLALGATGTIGGILGLIKGRKRKLFGKTIYTFGGAALGTGILYGLLYPDEVTKLYQDVYVEGERLSKIAVNFVQGVTPEETSPTKDTSEDLKVLSAEDKASLDKLSPSDE